MRCVDQPGPEPRQLARRLPRHAPDLAGRSGRLRAQLAVRAGVAPEAVRILRAPYRICPLGAHVDHQYGPVLALAIEQALLLAYVPTDDGRIEVHSNDYGAAVHLRSDAPAPRSGDWADHLRGALMVLGAEQPLTRGLVGIVDGALSEAGLSSSAAVGLAWIMALADADGRVLDAVERVRAQGRIEREFLGLTNGLLDPAAVAFGRQGQLLHIDTRSLAVTALQAPAGAQDVTFLAVASGQRAALVASSSFNERVAECRQAAALLARQAGLPDVDSRLGDLPSALLLSHGAQLPAPLDRRVRHFVTETERVALGADAWRRGDMAAFGALMNASADSSLHAYETGSAPLRDLLGLLQRQSGVLGARFSGAGFRGCCVALVARDAVDAILDAVGPAYARLHPELAAEAWALTSDPADGAAST